MELNLREFPYIPLIAGIFILFMMFIGFVAITRPAYPAECHRPRVSGPNALKDGQVILTFDDGPIPGNTPTIQQILKDNCIAAVFFVIGKNASQHPELVRMVAYSGHIVGSHSWSHPQPFNHLSNATTASEIDKGVQTLTEIIGPNHNYFRYPGFGHNSFTDHFIAHRGLIPWFANIDPRDWSEPGTNAIVNRILSQLKEEHKGIIVLHENHATTVKALPAIIHALRDSGYTIVGVN